MIQVTLNFPDQAALIAFFTANTGAVSAPEKAAVADIKPGKSKTAATPAATVAAPAASPEPATVSPSDPKAGGPTTSTTSSPEASVEPQAVDYPTLQKAVFALAGKSRDSAAAVAASFGVKTFKELDQSKWAEALFAVNIALAA